jgi:hypothetical protein
MALAHAAIRLGDAWAGLAPRDSLAALNTLAAIPYGVAATLLTRRLGRDDVGRGLVHLGLLGVGGMQLFCGYVEVYSWAFAMAALVLASALRAQGPGGVIRMLVPFGLGVLLHAVVALFAGPLVLSLLLRGRSTDTVRGPLRAAAAALLLGALVLPLAFPSLIYGYVAPGGALSLLSPALWWERLNGLLLASPAGTLLGLPLLVLGTVRLLRGRGAPERTELVLLSAALPVTVVLFQMKAVLGAADWDIQAFAGPPLFLWAGACLIRPIGRATLRALLPALIVLSLCNSWGFVAVNAGDASIRRLQEILWTDPAPYYAGHPPPLHLAFLFQANDLREEMYAALEEGVRRQPEDPRMAHNLASAHFQDGDLVQAKRWAREAVAVRPGYVPPIHLLFLIAAREGNADEALAIGEVLLEIESRQPELVGPHLSAGDLEHVRAVVARLRGPG